MALSSAALWPVEAANGFSARVARFASCNIKTTVVVSIALICGAFAAASALQMRFDRTHALDQANYFETRRASDIAAVAAGNLDRIEAQGFAFADDPLAKHAPFAVRNIAVYDAADYAAATLTGTTAFVRIPLDVLETARARKILIGGDGIAVIVSAHGASVVAIAFDTRVLIPPVLIDKAAVTTSRGAALLGTSARDDSIHANVPGWPATVAVAPDDVGALGAWYGSLPLYLFVILGPALVGAGLAAVFVGEFEKRARANQVVKALRSTPQADARLLVRLAQAERDVSEARRSKAEFISHMSHELRTPLNAVIGFSEIIERGMFGAVGNAKYVEYARDIGIAGRGLHAKIGDILEFANLESGRYPLRPAEIDLFDLAAAIVGEYVGRAFSRRIALDLTPSVPVPVHADPQAIRRILVSLISNALAYTSEGGRVRVTVTTADNACILTVQDNGPGFRPDEASRAGNAFCRFDREGAKTGTGLGLAIAMSLAARMGGALKLASAPYKGTRTELWIRR